MLKEIFGSGASTGNNFNSSFRSNASSAIEGESENNISPKGLTEQIQFSATLKSLPGKQTLRTQLSAQVFQVGSILDIVA